MAKVEPTPTLTVFQIARILRLSPTEVLARARAKPKAKRKANPRAKPYRIRQARGEIMLKVKITEIPVAEALISSGRLTDDEALIRSRVEAAVSQLVADWARRWASRPER